MEQQDILQILVEQDYITAENAEEAKTQAARQNSTPIEYLLRQELLDETTLGRAMAEHYHTTYTDLSARSPSAEVLAMIPETEARRLRLVFVEENQDGSLRLASDSLQEPTLAEEAQKLFPGKELHLTYASPQQIDLYLTRYQKELNTRFAEIVKHDRRVAPELFDEIIRDALSYNASDVHFEPARDATVIRFRIDGVLQHAGTISREHYESVLNRMKIQSNLRTDEHFLPQDGAIRFERKNENAAPIDLRLSIVPTLEGEKAVIRILAEYIQSLSFEALGFSAHHRELLARASAKPFGMILTVGPTGSGKTTTLYALLRQLNTPEINITTIEDPVEYRMAGTNQIQVNPKTDLTFARGLRAVMRQDPNIILVGEIRDLETAETAVNAALTGHLMLSTFHANNAASAIPRLLDMQVEPFLLASTLELLVAQRLARRICEACRVSYEASRAELEKYFDSSEGGAKKYFPEAKVTLYRAKGCATCNGSGYKGRVSIVEMIEATPELKELIGKRPSAGAIEELSTKQGNKTLFEDGLEKARAGITTIEEVVRVAPAR